MPHQGRPHPRQLIMAVLAVGLIAAVWRAGASSAVPAAQTPTAVAIADFSRVYEGLTELTDRNAKLAEQNTKYRNELDELSKQVSSLETDQRNSKPGSREYTELEIAIREAKQQAKARLDGINNRVALLVGNTNREIYMKFQGTVEFIAKRDGWELVLLDDRVLAQVPELAPPDVLTEAVTRKKVLFAASRIDITDTIISQMNNDYAANPPVDRTPPPPPPPPTAKQ